MSLVARIRHDPQRRTLAVLGIACLLFLLLAVAALWERSAELAPQYTPTAMFPDLNPNAVAAIRVRSRAGTFTVRHVGPHDWRIPEKNNFAADEAQAVATVKGVASLEQIEPKTANPAWLNQLGLVAPDKGGDATELTLMDARGHVLAAVLAGKGADIVDSQGRGAIYARKAGDNRSWLVRGYLMAKPNLADWLSKNIINVSAERIQSADVAPPTGSAYMVSRAKKEDADFTLAPIPPGREIAFESAADAPADAIVGFQFDDAQPIGGFDFSHPVVTHTTKTFDGLAVTVRIIGKNGAHWASVSAEATQPGVRAEAAAINARAGGWAFKLPDAKYAMFAATEDSLLKPLTPAGSGTAPAESHPGAPPAP